MCECEHKKGEEHSVEYLMMKMLHMYAAKTFHQLTNRGIHPGQMPMMNLIYHQEGLSQKEICDRLYIKPSTVTVSVQRMEKSGLIYRVPDEKDKRIMRIYLTDHGKELFQEVAMIRKEVSGKMLEGISKEEIAFLKEKILHMQENLKKMPGSNQMKDYMQ